MKERLSMEDVGTRMDHLAELHKLWSDGLALALTHQNSYTNDFMQELIDELEICLKHLTNHMSKDFVPTEYAKEINRIGTTPPEEEK